MTSGNKGEWSEIYAFMKLLKDGKIHAADENVQRIDSMYFPIMKIIREENHGEVYDYIPGEKVKIFYNGAFVKEVENSAFEEQATLIYDLMAANTKGNIAFNDFDSFM